MELLKIIMVAIVSLALIILVRQYRPELALHISIVAGVIVLLMALDALGSIISTLTDIAQKYGVSTDYLGVVIKIIGVAYLFQFAIGLCNDAGETALAGKVELGGKAVILVLVLPAVLSLLEMIIALLPGNGGA